jgi:hypothetical protein
MKKTVLSLLTIGILMITSCSPKMTQVLTTAENDAEAILNAQTQGTAVTQSDAASAIKEALTNGINHGVTQVSAVNGYLGNAAIKVLLPKEASNVETVLRDLGQGALVDKAVSQMNHAAEQAAPKATSIFINAISNISISDAISLVKSNQQDACTQFLKNATSSALVAAFRPSIQTALDQTHTTEAWSDVMGVYNKVPFVTPVNTDLTGYVSQKAVDGLFYTIAQEEAKIRQNPMAQVSDLIKRVFGSLLGTNNNANSLH